MKSSPAKPVSIAETGRKPGGQPGHHWIAIASRQLEVSCQAGDLHLLLPADDGSRRTSLRSDHRWPDASPQIAVRGRPRTRGFAAIAKSSLAERPQARRGPMESGDILDLLDRSIWFSRQLELSMPGRPDGSLRTALRLRILKKNELVGLQQAAAEPAPNLLGPPETRLSEVCWFSVNGKTDFARQARQ